MLCIIEDLKEDEFLKRTAGKDLDALELMVHWRLGVEALSGSTGLSFISL